MIKRYEASPKETKSMDTCELRDNFLLGKIMLDDEINLVYSHYDRIIIGGVKPVLKTIELLNEDELKADYFLQNREMGIINTGGKGIIEADGVQYELEKLEALYLGKGTKKIFFFPDDVKNPPAFFLLSAPAHQSYPNAKCSKADASPVAMGGISTSNKRTIYKYIHAEGIQSCQLVMGLTVLEDGCVWNSIPPHTHSRRMEVYFYFDLPEGEKVFHFMGEASQTRHLVLSNHEAVISPPWSVHFGAGTTNYGFIWGMAGENKTFTDMDTVPVFSLR